MAARAEAIALYRSLVRSSKQFATYNFREYFLRRTRYPPPTPPRRCRRRGPRAACEPRGCRARARLRPGARVGSAPRRGSAHNAGCLVRADPTGALQRAWCAGGGARAALTRVHRGREDFRQFKGETDPAKIQELLAYGRKELTVIQRQAQISQLYGSPSRSVLEERKTRAASRS